MRPKLLPQYLLIAAAALAAFGGCLSGVWVFDDLALLNDPVIASPSGWWECWRLTQTRPLSWFTFWANYQFGGQSPAGYHAVNLALHVAVALLLFGVLRSLIPGRAALMAAMLFAIHPALTEPVNYVYARPILLAALFSVLAIRSWISGRPWIAVVWFAWAMLSKEECAAIPVFLLLLDLSRRVKPRWTALTAMFGVALALGLRVVWAISVTPGALAGSQAGISPGAYLAMQGVVVLRYLRTIIVPRGFSVDYSATPAPIGMETACWMGVAALAVAAFWWFRELRAGFWFLAGLILLTPSSSIFPASDLAADRRMYLPMLAFAACAGVLLAAMPPRRTPAVAAAICVAFTAISIRYSARWRDPAALWSDAVEHAPEKLRPRLQLARSLPPDRAMEALDQARLLAPQDPAVPAEQGRILLSTGHPAEALGAFGRALALDPGNAGAINNRGTALAALGQPEAARADFERALSRDHCLFDARLNLARMGVQTSGAGCRYTPLQQQALDAPQPK